MILKKPYAFLIKHFKLIHAILTILYVYLAFYISSVLNYYNNFINGTVGKISAINYINNLPYIVVILSILLCIVLFILMNYKKKPKFLYMALIIVYIVVSVIIFITSNGLNTIYNNTLETRTLLLYRDFLRIIIVLQYASIVLTTIRAIGFDIKKFNFSKDIDELNIDLTDDEEVELVMGIDKHKWTQKWNRKIRELKYYFAENKMFIIIIIAILIVIGLSTITIDKTVVNKVYKENENFNSEQFKMKVTNSYISAKSYNGDPINTTSTFLIVELSIEPLQEDNALNTSNMILKTDKDTYTMTKKYYSYFKDLGTGYRSQTIKSSSNYILIYELPLEDSLQNLQLLYTATTNEIKVDLDPIKLDETTSTKEYKITEEIDFSDSILSGSNFQINSYDINNKYTYTYTYLIDNQEFEGKKYITSPSNTILYLEVASSYTIDTTNYQLIKDYGNIVYTVNGTEVTSEILSDKTPGNLKNGIYIEVDKNIENAESIWIELNIRNVSYKYILK